MDKLKFNIIVLLVVVKGHLNRGHISIAIYICMPIWNLIHQAALEILSQNEV